ncbi:MAG: hypothetical protein ABMB14_40295, partial [Myxococcota bacterium]
MYVRSALVALVIAAPGIGWAADAPAGSALLGADGLVQILPVAPVTGGGAPVELYAVALNPDGTPMTGLSLTAVRTLGVDKRWTEVGGGVYRLGFVPPAVDERSVVTITAKGKASTGAKVSVAQAVELVPEAVLAATVTPTELTLGRDPGASLAVAGASAAG